MRHLPVTLLLVLSTAGCVLAQSTCEAEPAGCRSAGIAESSTGAGGATRGIRHEPEDRRRSGGVLPGSGRGCYRLAGQSTGAHWSGVPDRLPPLQPHRPRHHPQPVDYGFRTHTQPGRQLAAAGRRRRADGSSHQVRRPRARQSGLLRNAPRTGAGQGRAGDGGGAPVARGSGNRALQQQASLGIGRQLRGCESVAGEAAAAPDAG